MMSLIRKTNQKLSSVFLVSFFMICSVAFCNCSSDNGGGEVNPPHPTTPEEQEKPGEGYDLWGYIKDETGKPVRGVVVTDGFQSVATNKDGLYQMNRKIGAKYVYYSTPADFKIEVATENIQVARFYQLLKKEEKRYDFQLERLKERENRFTLIAIGDPQVKNQSEIDRFKKEIIPDIQDKIASLKTPAYGIVLGDLMDTKEDVFPNIRRAVGSIGIPILPVIGNHDKLKGASVSEPRTTEVYERYFGPLNYSYNRGKVHFIAMDNIIYDNANDYRGGFTYEQVEWLKSDLKHVSKDHMIILYYHIPLRNHSKYQYRDEVLKLLAGYAEVHLMAGHTHYNENYLVKSPIDVYEHIHAAACGAWWWSIINGDGTPNGYAVYEIDGSHIKNWYYKSANYDDNHQIRLHKGDASFGGPHGYFSFQQKKEVLVANIWNADPEWKVEIYEDGKLQGTMKPWDFNQDAWAKGYHIGVVGRNEKNYSQPTKHLFYHQLSNPDAQVRVVATDRFGNKYEETEITTDMSTAGAYQ